MSIDLELVVAVAYIKVGGNWVTNTPFVKVSGAWL